MTKQQVLEILKSKNNAANAEGMKRFGINGKCLGISIPELRNIAKNIKKDHELSMSLYNNDIHEAKILSIFIADKDIMTNKDIDIWLEGFDSWDLVDQACMRVLRYMPTAIERIEEFAKNDKEFIRRTAFSLIASIAADKKNEYTNFQPYYPLILKYASDERKMVYQAVDWALRNIGKRSMTLRSQAVLIATELLETGNKIDRRVAKRTLNELTSEKIIQRIQSYESKNI